MGVAVMRVLVTGGAGFIGSHLSERFLDLGHRVTVIDDLSTGSLDNLASVMNSPEFSCHVNSILQPKLLTKLIQQADIICHLAAAVGVRRILSQPVDSIERNVRGTSLLLSLAAENGKRVLLTSSSEVYGRSSDIPFSETGELVLGSTESPHWNYGCSKALNEFLAFAYYRQFKLPITVVRLFNVVGPRQTAAYGMVLPTFVAQALANEPLTVFGSGEQTRCFTYVADIVEGMITCATSERAIGEIFNLGSTEEISVNSLASRVIAVTQSKSAVWHLPYSQAYGSGFEETQRRVPDTSKARGVLGYVTKWSLNQIIQTVVEDARSRSRPYAQLLSHAC